MGVLGILRRLRGAGGIVLLFLCGFMPITRLIQLAIEWSHEETVVAATEIQVTGTPTPICHHHPEGCPKDCFCPKIVPEDSEPAHAHEGGTVREASLVRCTEHAPGDFAPHLTAAWLDPITGFPDLQGPAGKILAAATASAHAPYFDPPLPVPRA